jgi:hypothetical protein
VNPNQADQYTTEKMTHLHRERLMALAFTTIAYCAPPVQALSFAEDARIEAETIPGWNLYFIPAEGPLAGQPIRRTFIVGPIGKLGHCASLMREKYGAASHLLAGRSLHSDDQFGDWDAE